MHIRRSFGVLLHPTSLHGNEGVGTLGQCARDFITWLQQAKASWWQVLPLGVTGYGDSPYQSFSAFAGNPYLIDWDYLVERDWAVRPDADSEPTPSRVDYGSLHRRKWPLLRAAFQRFEQVAVAVELTEFENFIHGEAYWLDDYCLFMALKDQHGGAPWTKWPAGLRDRDPEAIAEARGSQASTIRFHGWTQWLFFQQWQALRDAASACGISVIGDMPIFVSHDSCDVWANRQYFSLDDTGNPTVVAGVPPDYFSSTGQRWGNPLYRWDEMEEDGFRWWLDRIRGGLKLYDMIRVDHFRGFSAYWEIPAGEPDAVKGRWVSAPGRRLFSAINRELDKVPIVAEDLGQITSEVEELREEFCLPGMKVLQFAFEDDSRNPFLPHNYQRHGNFIVYTGTHDNDTTMGWYKAQTTRKKETIKQYLAQHELPLDTSEEAPWALTSLAFRSNARIAVVPMQDILELGSEARMNTPAGTRDNWTWRLLPEQLKQGHAERVRLLAQNTQREETSAHPIIEWRDCPTATPEK